MSCTRVSIRLGLAHFRSELSLIGASKRRVRDALDSRLSPCQTKHLPPSLTKMASPQSPKMQMRPLEDEVSRIRTSHRSSSLVQNFTMGRYYTLSPSACLKIWSTVPNVPSGSLMSRRDSLYKARERTILRCSSVVTIDP